MIPDSAVLLLGLLRATVAHVNVAGENPMPVQTGLPLGLPSNLKQEPGACSEILLLFSWSHDFLLF